MNVLVFAIFKAGIHLVRNYAIVFEHIHHVDKTPALGKVSSTIKAYKLTGLVLVAFTGNKHFREVGLNACFAQNLIFNERYAREAPASPRLVLIFYRGGLGNLNIGKLETGAVGHHNVVVGNSSERSCQHCKN